jgi:hypothetical protein
VVTLCTVRFNTHKYYVQPTHCIYVVCVALRTNSYCFPVQHWLVCITETVCLLRGTDRIPIVFQGTDALPTSSTVPASVRKPHPMGRVTRKVSDAMSAVKTTMPVRRVTDTKGHPQVFLCISLAFAFSVSFHWDVRFFLADSLSVRHHTKEDLH